MLRAVGVLPVSVTIPVTPLGNFDAVTVPPPIVHPDDNDDDKVSVTALDDGKESVVVLEGKEDSVVALVDDEVSVVALLEDKDSVVVVLEDDKDSVVALDKDRNSVVALDDGGNNLDAVIVSLIVAVTVTIIGGDRSTFGHNAWANSPSRMLSSKLPSTISLS